jgi:hypothetical protein
MESKFDKGSCDSRGSFSYGGLLEIGYGSVEDLVDEGVEFGSWLLSSSDADDLLVIVAGSRGISQVRYPLPLPAMSAD